MGTSGCFVTPEGELVWRATKNHRPLVVYGIYPLCGGRSIWDLVSPRLDLWWKLIYT